MSTRRLPELVAPRGEAGQELAALLADRAKLDERLDALDDQQRAASEVRDQASAELADLERGAASGQQVTAAQRAKAETALTQARIAHGAPWAERRAGLTQAAREADQALTAFVASHFEELLAEHNEDAEAAAKAVNRAISALLAACAERDRLDQQVTALCAMVQQPRPGSVTRSKTEALIREANRLLEAGGETAPTLRVDPDEPRHGQAVEPAGQAASF